jgi:uncharacterized protein (DUF433 family)
MKEYRIVDRGDGPKIAGTRITVYTVLEYLEEGYSREWIALTLGLSSRQVQAAIDYIACHRDEVQADFDKIMERIRKGNPPEVQQRLERAREKFRRMVANRKCKATERAEDHGGQ